MDVQNSLKTFSPQRPGWAQLKHTQTCTHMKKDTMASLYEHSAEQDQSRAKPKCCRCKNMDRVMSKKMEGGGNRTPERDASWDGMENKSPLYAKKGSSQVHTQKAGDFSCLISQLC